MNDKSEPKRYYGKYRGTVLDNIDVEFLGRVQVQVPDVFGLGLSSWAMPCVPVAGMQAGIYAVPPLLSGVWVEFEQGDPDKPIWVGGFWAIGEPPTLAIIPPPVPPGQNICLQTTLQNMVLISDVPGPTGGIMLKTTLGAFISINDLTGITISDGKGAIISMLGPLISINGTAFVSLAPL